MTMKLIHSATTSNSDTCAELVGRALAADRFDLDTFQTLSELPAVERFAAAYPHALLPRGKALQLLLERTVAEVATAYAEDSDRPLRKIAKWDGSSWSVAANPNPSSGQTWAAGSATCIGQSLIEFNPKDDKPHPGL